MKPREKAMQFGLSNVTDLELVALIVGSGSKSMSVFTMAKKLISLHPLATWQQIQVSDFQKITGFGLQKSLQLAACIEVGRRIFKPARVPVIRTSHDASMQAAHLITRQREEVLCLYLNARQELLKKETIAIGGLNYSNLNPRDVFAPALKLPCAAVILIHNHPSGDPTPSQEDIAVTKTLFAAGKLLGIQLIDHVIVGNDKHRSLAELGYIN